MSTRNTDMRRDVRTAHRTQVEVGSQNLQLTAREVWLGAIAGLGAGAAMGLVATIVALSNNLGLWAPFNDVAGALFPGLLTDRGAFNIATVIVGLIIHFAISALLGMLFTIIYSGLLKLTFNFGVPMTMGLAYSWIIWMAVRFLVLPWLGSGVYEEPSFIIAHAVFGVALGFLYPWLRNQRIVRPTPAPVR